MGARSASKGYVGRLAKKLPWVSAQGLSSTRKPLASKNALRPSPLNAAGQPPIGGSPASIGSTSLWYSPTISCTWSIRWVV